MIRSIKGGIKYEIKKENNYHCVLTYWHQKVMIDPDIEIEDASG